MAIKEKQHIKFPNTLRSIALLCRILLSITFLFSGFVKAVDPLGTTYKLTDYFNAFSYPALSSASLYFAFMLSIFEFWLGGCLLIGHKPKRSALFALLMIGIMTPLTFYLAITNPISDCGCFGDAIVLSNWQTFYKNLILLSLAVVVFYNRKNWVLLLTPHTSWLVSVYGLFFSIVISLTSYHLLPLFDFRPYKVGTNIPKAMAIPEGMPEDKYESILTYEKEGIQKEFTIKTAPIKDTTWQFISNQSRLTQKGYTPPIHNFELYSQEGEEITQQLLNDSSFVFLLIAYDLEQANDNDNSIDQVNEIYDFCQKNNYPFYCLTASTDEQITNWAEDTGAEYPFAKSDAITLKTIIRSNPGLLLLHKGTIIQKWACSQLPELNESTKSFNQTTIQLENENKNKSFILFLFFAFIFPLLLLFIIEKAILYFIRKIKRTKRKKIETKK